jgi:hypothetical protein
MNETTKSRESVSVPRKVHEDGGITETNLTTECTKEKEPEREINPPWGRHFRGLLYSPCSILS